MDVFDQADHNALSLNSMTDSSQRADIAFALGIPGAGKGTLCAKLALDFPLYHLSTGDYLRSISGRDNSSEPGDGINIKKYLQDRRLLPPKAIVEILEQKIVLENRRGHRLIIIDGFPRTEASAELFEQVVSNAYEQVDLEC